MYPYLFAGTPYQIPTWDVFHWIGAIVIIVLGVFVFQPKDFELSWKMRLIPVFVFLTFGLLAGRAVSIVLHLQAYLDTDTPIAPLMFNTTSASIGSYIFNVIAIFFLKSIFAKHIGYRQALDFVIPLFAIHMIFIRIGCFLNGCCFGARTNLPWACKFYNSAYLRHPTQIYSIIVLIFVLFLCHTVYKKDLPPGSTFFSAVSVYSFFRALIEMLRVDSFQITNGITFATAFMFGIFLLSTTALIVNFKISDKRYTPNP